MILNIQINLTDELIDKIVESNKHIFDGDEDYQEVKQTVIDTVTEFVSELKSDDGLCNVLENLDYFND